MAEFGELLGQSAATSALGLGFNLVGNSVNGLINNVFYRRNLELQKQAQKELIDYQNAYNSPSAQMQRLAEAGLNPHLVYGSQAPAGISGNASAPGGSMPPGGFNTADVSAAMLRMQQIEGVQSQIDLNDAYAQKARADALFTMSQNDRYNELVDVQISEANQRINKLASDIDLNHSTIQYQIAQKLLAEADAAYKYAEISLTEYRKQQMIAQTALYTAQKHLTYTENYYRDVEGQMQVLELEYQKLFYDANGDMKNLAKSEREALENEFKTKAAKSAIDIGIEGNKVTRWTDWVMSEIGRILGGAGTAAIGAAVATRPGAAGVVKKIR